jgi:glycerol-3-phosphate dehydrogenase
VSTHALLISAASDNRVLFVIPHGDYSIVGTTDTPYSGSPDSVTATAPDIQYLMNEVERVFDLKLTRSDIYATFAGLRPLANSVQDTPAAISRDHELIRHSESFFSIIGGKYTTFRSMSEDAAKAIMKRLSLPFLNSTRTLPLGPGPFLNHEDRLTRLSESVRHSIANEFACHISDYLRRRTDAFFRKGNGLEIVDEVAAIFAEVLQWTPEQTAAETEAYRNQVATMHAEINLVLP